MPHSQKRAKAVATGRRVKVPAFGRYLKTLRTHAGLSQEAVAENASKRGAIASKPVIVHLEQGKTESPDPVLLKELGSLYGIQYDGLVELLRRSRQHPNALIHELQAAPEEGDMVVRGYEEQFVLRFRKLTTAQQREVFAYMEYVEHQQGGAAPSVEATFRTKRRS